MKKVYLSIGAVLAAGLSVYLVVSNQQAGNDVKKVDTEKSTSTTSGNSKTSEVKKVDYSLYEPVLARYQSSLHQPVSSIDQEQVSSYVSFLDTYSYLYSELVSLQYDFNKDGVDELAIALKDKKGSYTLIDLYTLNSSNQVVRLADEFRKTGPEIGEKTMLFPLEDGTFSLQGRDFFRIYEMKADRSGLEYITEGQTNPSDSLEVNLAKLSWSQVGGDGASASDSQKSTAKMDIQALASGDFSSIAGTWQNGDGQVMVFDANGVVDDKMTMSQFGARIENDYYAHGLSPKAGGAGGVSALFIPEGVDISTESAKDASDHSRNRIWTGQAYSEFANPNAFFYKVD